MLIVGLVRVCFKFVVVFVMFWLVVNCVVWFLDLLIIQVVLEFLKECIVGMRYCCVIVFVLINV